jgi:hypothetical protein
MKRHQLKELLEHNLIQFGNFEQTPETGKIENSTNFDKQFIGILNVPPEEK